jgi:diguanylate cyclase (GGDEF)-like protein
MKKPINKKLFIKYCCSIFFLLFIFIILGSYTFYKSEKNIAVKDLHTYEKHKISSAMELIENKFKTCFSDILIFSKQNSLMDYLDSPGRKNFKKLINDHKQLFIYRKNLLQIRFLDLNGMEKTRVDINNIDQNITNHIFQNKKNRYYFKESIGMMKNQVYVSQFDLNIENGEIEVPYKPTLRVATTVWDRRNRKRGILIINFLGKNIITELKRISKFSKSRLFLLNKNSYSFYGMKNGKNWGFMFEDKKNIKFSTFYSEEWENIIQVNHNKFFTKNGFFTSQKVFIPGYNKNKFWVLVSFVPDHKIIDKHLINNVFLFGIILSIIVLFISLLISLLFVKRKQYYEHLQHSATYDLLTNLPNRALFYDRLNHLCNQSERYGKQFGILYIDLDGFKIVNDTFGHNIGDEVLRKTALRLKLSVRNSDTIARIGGDEFAVILMNISNKKDVKTISNKIISSVSKIIAYKTHSINIGASMGIFLCNKKTKLTTTEIMQIADRAMYIAKNTGKNKYYFANEDTEDISILQTKI